MKKINLFLAGLICCLGLSAATVSIVPQEDAPAFYCKYSGDYSIAGPLGGTTNLSQMVAPNRFVIVAEDGQQYWYPFSDNNFYTQYIQDQNRVVFYANGYFYPNANQIREIKNIKIARTFVVFYQLDVEDPALSIKSPDLHINHSSILYHRSAEKPTIPGNIVRGEIWTESNQSIINQWDPNKAYIIPNDGVVCQYNENSDLGILFNLDSTVQITASLTYGKVQDIQKNFIKQLTLTFDDNSMLIIPMPTNSYCGTKDTTRVYSCSAPIPFLQLKDKFATALSIETYSGEVEGDNSRLIDAFNDKIAIEEFPYLVKSPYYRALSHMDVLKEAPQIFFNEENKYVNNNLPNERKYSTTFTTPRKFYMQQDKATKKFNLCDYEGKEIISPIFPKIALTSRTILKSFCYQVDECAKAGITEEMWKPVFDYANYLEYYSKSKKEHGFITKTGKRVIIPEKAYVVFDNQDVVVTEEPGDDKFLVWKVYNMDGEELTSDRKQIRLFNNGLILKGSQFYYTPSIEPILPVDFPSEEYKQKYLFSVIESRPNYRITANRNMYFDNCLIKDPSDVLRNIVIAIPEKSK